MSPVTPTLFTTLFNMVLLPTPFYAAEDVHLPVKLPYNMAAAAPKRVYLNLLQVIGVFLHNIKFIVT